MPITMYIDPGVTTGWASYSELGFKCGQHDFQGIGNYLEHVASRYGPDLHLGWEAFLITPMTARKSDSHWSIEVIGVARWIAAKYGCKVLPAYPSSALIKAGDSQLKRLGWYQPGQRHADDAAQHLLHYLLDHRILPKSMVNKLVAVEKMSAV